MPQIRSSASVSRRRVIVAMAAAMSPGFTWNDDEIFVDPRPSKISAEPVTGEIGVYLEELLCPA